LREVLIRDPIRTDFIDFFLSTCVYLIPMQICMQHIGSNSIVDNLIGTGHAGGTEQVEV
jgi:hypothetical protein